MLCGAFCLTKRRSTFTSSAITSILPHAALKIGSTKRLPTRGTSSRTSKTTSESSASSQRIELDAAAVIMDEWSLDELADTAAVSATSLRIMLAETQAIERLVRCILAAQGIRNPEAMPAPYEASADLD